MNHWLSCNVNALIAVHRSSIDRTSEWSRTLIADPVRECEEWHARRTTIGQHNGMAMPNA